MTYKEYNDYNKTLETKHGQVEALYDLFLWLAKLRPLNLDGTELLALIENEVYNRVKDIADEVK